MEVLIPISNRWPQLAAGTIGGPEGRERYDTNAQTLPFAFRERGVVRAGGPRKTSITIILPKTEVMGMEVRGRILGKRCWFCVKALARKNPIRIRLWRIEAGTPPPPERRGRGGGGENSGIPENNDRQEA